MDFVFRHFLIIFSIVIMTLISITSILNKTLLLNTSYITESYIVSKDFLNESCYIENHLRTNLPEKIDCYIPFLLLENKCKIHLYEYDDVDSALDSLSIYKLGQTVYVYSHDNQCSLYKKFNNLFYFET